ncbi:hypothetical protein [uncultured Paraglaciecola sp.]|uniref:hypothetical protein n=1 Tax=uncultured Paraglaciecola sp. TaxID=1765024 RepID=UPI0034587007
MIILLTSQITREHNTTTDDAYEILMDMPPSEIQSRLEAVLENYQSLSDLPQKLETLHAQGNTEHLNWQQNSGLRAARNAGRWLAGLATTSRYTRSSFGRVFSPNLECIETH